MQTIIDGLRDALQWCADNPGALFWLIIPATLVVIWTIYKIVRLSVISKHDNVILEELAEFQHHAVTENLSAEDRTKGYVEILGKRRSTIGLLMYKYAISHENFSELKKYLTYDEVLKVAKRQPRRRLQYRKVSVISIFLPLLLIFGSAVALSYASNDFAIFRDGGTFTTDVAQTSIISIAALLFFIACSVLLFIYKRTVLRFKAEMLGKLEESADEFFAPIEPEYDFFCQEIIKAINPNGKMRKAVKKLVNKEGLQFRQIHHDRVEEAVVSEEEIDAKLEEELEDRACALAMLSKMGIGESEEQDSEDETGEVEAEEVQVIESTEGQEVVSGLPQNFSAFFGESVQSHEQTSDEQPAQVGFVIEDERSPEILNSMEEVIQAPETVRMGYAEPVVQSAVEEAGAVEDDKDYGKVEDLFDDVKKAIEDVEAEAKEKAKREQEEAKEAKRKERAEKKKIQGKKKKEAEDTTIDEILKKFEDFPHKASPMFDELMEISEEREQELQQALDVLEESEQEAKAPAKPSRRLPSKKVTARTKPVRCVSKNVVVHAEPSE